MDRVNGPSDVRSGAALLVVTLAYGTGALRIPGQDGEPGPGLLPITLTVLLGVMACVIVTGGWRRGAGDTSAPESDSDAEDHGHAPGELPPPTSGRWTRPWLAVLATLLYAALFQPLGFALSTVAYSAATTALFTTDRKALLAVPALVTVGLFAFFRLALGVRLPTGPFG